MEQIDHPAKLWPGGISLILWGVPFLGAMTVAAAKLDRVLSHGRRGAASWRPRAQEDDADVLI